MHTTTAIGFKFRQFHTASGQLVPGEGDSAGEWWRSACRHGPDEASGWRQVSGRGRWAGDQRGAVVGRQHCHHLAGRVAGDHRHCAVRGCGSRRATVLRTNGSTARVAATAALCRGQGQVARSVRDARACHMAGGGFGLAGRRGAHSHQRRAG